MSGQRMHADEIDTDAGLVRRLLAGQFPQWADLPIAPVPSAGTDNALYRLGADLVVRRSPPDRHRRWPAIGRRRATGGARRLDSLLITGDHLTRTEATVAAGSLW